MIWGEWHLKMEQNDYIYDIFLSYRRKPPVGDWVKNHFYPLLDQWLPQAMSREPNIFIDLEEIEIGSRWSRKISNALKVSRCLLPIWSADYFQSTWCLAEWHSMMKREDLLGYKTEQNPAGLIYPVVFFDGEHFPPEAQQTQQKDLRKWNISSPVFAETRGFVELEKEMQSIVVDIAEMLNNVPKWQSNWPIVTPDIYSGTTSTVSIQLPRLQ